MTQVTSKLEAVAIDWDWVLLCGFQRILSLQVKIKSLYDMNCSQNFLLMLCNHKPVPLHPNCDYDLIYFTTSM